MYKLYKQKKDERQEKKKDKMAAIRTIFVVTRDYALCLFLEMFRFYLQLKIKKICRPKESYTVTQYFEAVLIEFEQFSCSQFVFCVLHSLTRIEIFNDGQCVMSQSE